MYFYLLIVLLLAVGFNGISIKFYIKLNPDTPYSILLTIE